MKRIKFNDVFAVWLTGMMVALWGLHGRGLIEVPELVLGVTVSVVTMIVVFYFRKKPDEPTK